MNKRINDEELQRIIFEAKRDDGLNFGYEDFDSESGDYYRILKRVLGAAPPTDLSENFAQQVTQKAVRKKYRYNMFRTTALYLGSFFVFIGFCALAFLFLAKDILHTLIEGALVYKVPLAFGLLIFALVQMLDKLLVRRSQRQRVG